MDDETFRRSLKRQGVRDAIGRGEVVQPSGVRYRAVIVCKYERCRQHHEVGQRDVPGVDRFGPGESEFTFATPEEAFEYGSRMNTNVYGADIHRVEVEGQLVTPWQVIPDHDMVRERWLNAGKYPRRS